MKKTKDNTQTGKNSKNERIRACMDELKHLLAMTCRESIRVALLASLAKDVEMLFGSYYDNKSLDAIIEHTQNQIVYYMSNCGGVVSKPEVMLVFGESDITRDALDGLIDDEKIAVINGEFTTIGYYFPKA